MVAKNWCQVSLNLQRATINRSAIKPDHGSVSGEQIGHRLSVATIPCGEQLFVERTDLAFRTRVGFRMRHAESDGAELLTRHDGGRYRIRTYDFHRVKMALYR